MVGLLGFGKTALGVVAKNPFKTVLVVILLGVSIGTFFVGKGLVDDYNETKDRIAEVEVENNNLQKKLDNQIRTAQEISNRLADVEESRARIDQEITESQDRIAQYEYQLRQLDLDNVTIEEGSARVNEIWNRNITCLERASRGEEESCQNDQ